jgi:GTP pyrophosphokinase
MSAPRFDDQPETAVAVGPAEPAPPQGAGWEDLLAVIRRRMPGMDISVVKQAHDFARDAHEGKFRRSGEPYISHPVEVAIILAEMQLDQETLAAALLHDVVEDTDTTMEELRTLFGDRIVRLVDGVTKLGRIRWAAETDQAVREKERQAESLRKMFLAMVDDVRVVLIKLADRLHNMRTL